MLRTLRLLLLPLVLSATPAARAAEDPAPKSRAPHAAHVHAADTADKSAGSDGSSEKADSPSRKRPALHGTVNLNGADEATLELLPGVGEKKAARILTYRKAHPFKRIEDLTKVRGFGRKTLAHLRPYLSIAGPSTLGDEESAASKSQ